MTAPAQPAPAPADDPAQLLEDILQQLQQIIDGAQGRDLTDDEVQRYEALEGKMERARRTAEVQKRNAAYRAVPAGQILHVAAAKNDDTLERAFAAFLRTGQENGDIAELRAQGEGVGAQGGYLVPEGFRNKIVERMKAFGGIGNVVENITTDTGAPLPWVSVDDTGNTGEVVNENGAWVSGAPLVFGTNELSAYTYAAGDTNGVGILVPRELAQDSAVDLEGLVTRKLGERLARALAPHLVSGDGVKKPLGLVTGLTGVQITHAGIKYDDLINIVHSVDPAYRESGCRWAFNDATFKTIKLIKDSNGDPIWRPLDANMATNSEGGSNGVLLDYPVTIDQGFANINLASNTVNFGAFGDLQRGYVKRMVRDVQMIVNPWSYANKRQIEYSAWMRADGTQQDTNAYVAITAATS
jgi:HK97 family phage major capsid protein